jgi:type IV secretory pathway VirD2 relaxase
VIAHKLVFSISEDEQTRLSTNMRDLVREVMDAWSQSLGRVLKWIGFEHDDAGHPHVHVVVAGYADGKQVGVYERDLRDLRSWAEREKERQVERGRPRREDRTIEQEVECLTRGLGREHEIDRGR